MLSNTPLLSLYVFASTATRPAPRQVGQSGKFFGLHPSDLSQIPQLSHRTHSTAETCSVCQHQTARPSSLPANFRHHDRKSIRLQSCFRGTASLPRPLAAPAHEGEVRTVKGFYQAPPHSVRNLHRIVWRHCGTRAFRTNPRLARDQLPRSVPQGTRLTFCFLHCFTKQLFERLHSHLCEETERGPSALHAHESHTNHKHPQGAKKRKNSQKASVPDKSTLFSPAAPAAGPLSSIGFWPAEKLRGGERKPVFSVIAPS